MHCRMIGALQNWTIEGAFVLFVKSFVKIEEIVKSKDKAFYECKSQSLILFEYMLLGQPIYHAKYINIVRLLDDH